LEPIRLDIPGVICTFQAYPAFNDVRPLFDRALSFMRQEADGPTEWTRRRVAIINSRFHMKSVGEPMQIDKFLITPRTFSIFIEEEEARFWLQAA
jgi:hypothetical protein